jgi:uncharacterized protein YcbX
MTDIRVSKIVLYPIKALDGISVQSAAFVPSGALKHDREFALYNEAGRWINGKSEARLNTIRSEYDLANFTVKLTAPTKPASQTLHLLDERPDLERWFSEVLEIPVHLKRDTDSGFPDDTHAKGPTLIGAGTIAEVGSWYSIQDPDETRRRFRANIELAVDTPFWEDQLFGRRDHDVGFTLGEVQFFGVGPCKRCVVPVRDSVTGAVTENFEKTFVAKRLASMPDWVNRARFGPLFYRLAVNTRVNASEVSKCLSVGDALQLTIPT